MNVPEYLRNISEYDHPEQILRFLQDASKDD
jgi:hypothetical protein